MEGLSWLDPGKPPRPQLQKVSTFRKGMASGSWWQKPITGRLAESLDIELPPYQTALFSELVYTPPEGHLSPNLQHTNPETGS